MSDSSKRNEANGVGMNSETVVEIPEHTNPDAPVDRQKKNGNFPSRSRRSVWFGNSFGPLGKYGKLKKMQFVMGARNLEVRYVCGKVN